MTHTNTIENQKCRSTLGYHQTVLKILSINNDKKTTYETHIALNIRKQTPINKTVLE